MERNLPSFARAATIGLIRAHARCPSVAQITAAAQRAGDAWAQWLPSIIDPKLEDDDADFHEAAQIGRALVRAIVRGCRHAWMTAAFARFEEVLLHGNPISQNVVIAGAFEAMQSEGYESLDFADTRIRMDNPCSMVSCRGPRGPMNRSRG